MNNNLPDPSNRLAVSRPSSHALTEHGSAEAIDGHTQNGLAMGVGPRSVSSYVGSAMPAMEDDEDEGIDLRALWGMLRRRKWIIMAVVLSVLILGAVITLRTRPVFQSSATILVNTSSASSQGTEDLPVLSDLLSNTRARSLETQIEVLKSVAVQEGALERLDPALRSALQRYYVMNVAPVRNTDIISVTVNSHSPEAAAAMANAICAEYTLQNQKQNREQIRTATEYVRDQLQTVRQRLDDARRKLLRFKQVNNSVDLASESEQRVTQLSQIQADLRQVQAERAANVAQLEKTRALVARMAPTEVVPGEITRRPAVQMMKEQLTKLEIERLAARQEYTPQSPQVQNLTGQIEALKLRLNREAQTEISSWQRSVNPVRQSLVQDIAKLQGQIWALDARQVALARDVSQSQAALLQLPRQEYLLGQLTTDASALQQTYQMLNEKYQSLRLSEEARLANVRVLNTAKAPGAPISPQKSRNMLMALVLGTILALALAALIERLDDRVHSESEATEVTRLMTLAQVPYIKEAGLQSLLGNTDKPSPLLESYRMLRTNIEFSAIDEPIRCITITSSQPNEGKTTSSTDLAVVMAMDNKRVILVDADLRRPSLHRLFNVPNTVGFTSVVAGAATLEEALQETSVPGLRVLTSGPVPPNPPELLNSKASRNCFQRIREISDFVIIDTPPALVMTDARIVATISDAVVVVVSLQEAGRHEIARTCEQLMQTGTRVVGTIVNKVTAENGGYYSYYSYKNRYYGRYLSEGDSSQN